MIIHQAWVGILGEYCWFMRFFKNLEAAQAWLEAKRRENQRLFPQIEYHIFQRELIEDLMKC